MNESGESDGGKPMTVQELIDRLMEVKDKETEVRFIDYRDDIYSQIEQVYIEEESSTTDIYWDWH